jgi:hypothetical protein
MGYKEQDLEKYKELRRLAALELKKARRRERHFPNWYEQQIGSRKGSSQLVA